MSGKGSAQRPTDLKRFADNWDTTFGREEPPTTIDPVCLIHGKKASEHECLYCCLCFRTMTIDECHVLPSGAKEDVCEDCAKAEAACSA
jgi:hypothetical protein